MPIKDIDDFSDEKTQSFVKDADMRSKQHNKPMGRPKKSEDKKAVERVAINITTKQKEKLQQSADDLNMSVSQYVKFLLKREGAL